MKNNNYSKITKYTECNSYKEFIEKSEAKWKRHENVFCGESINYTVNSEERIKDVLSCISKEENINLFEMMQELREHIGCTVKAKYANCKGILKGVEISCEDYYYIVDDGKKEFYVNALDQLYF